MERNETMSKIKISTDSTSDIPASFREELQIIGSIARLDTDRPAYVMEYNSDYHLDDVVKQGVSSDEELTSLLSGYISHGFYRWESHGDVSPGCSTLAAKTPEGNALWGRNFDWRHSCLLYQSPSPLDLSTSLMSSSA